MDKVSSLFPPFASPLLSTHHQTHTPPLPPPTIRPPKLQLSFFEGPDPLEWLFQTEQ